MNNRDRMLELAARIRRERAEGRPVALIHVDELAMRALGSDAKHESPDWVVQFLEPPVDYDFSDEFSVTLPAHQWQLLLRASKHGVEHVTGIAQAYQEIAMAYRRAERGADL